MGYTFQGVLWNTLSALKRVQWSSLNSRTPWQSGNPPYRPALVKTLCVYGPMNTENFPLLVVTCSLPHSFAFSLSLSHTHMLNLCLRLCSSKGAPSSKALVLPGRCFYCLTIINEEFWGINSRYKSEVHTGWGAGEEQRQKNPSEGQSQSDRV